jgi:hypothetical protein
MSGDNYSCRKISKIGLKIFRVEHRSWRKLNAQKLMQKVYERKLFRDGIAVKTKIEPTRKAA